MWLLFGWLALLFCWYQTRECNILLLSILFTVIYSVQFTYPICRDHRRERLEFCSVFWLNYFMVQIMTFVEVSWLAIVYDCKKDWMFQNSAREMTRYFWSKMFYSSFQSDAPDISKAKCIMAVLIWCKAQLKNCGIKYLSKVISWH